MNGGYEKNLEAEKAGTNLRMIFRNEIQLKYIGIATSLSKCVSLQKNLKDHYVEFHTSRRIPRGFSVALWYLHSGREIIHTTGTAVRT